MKLSPQFKLMSIWIMRFMLLRRSFFLLMFSFMCLLAQAGSALASSDDYIVNDVDIAASGANPSQARTNAIANAQRSAFATLLERLDMNTDIAGRFDAAAIADMVSSQQITDEKIAGNNYSATLNITFSESFVKHYLSDKTIVQSSDKPEILLLVPIKMVGNQKLIWEENNDWKTAWQLLLSQNSSNRPVIKLPKGDADDMAAVNAAALDDDAIVNYTDFESMLTKYRADTLILAFFNFDNIENKVNISLKIIKKFQYKPVRLSFVNVNQLDQQDLINKVADKTFEYINSSRSKNAQGLNASSSKIEFDVLINSLGDWMTIKNKLENQNLVEKMTVNSISRDLVKVSVVYNNSNGEISSFFAKNDLFLQKKSEGQYFLSLLTGAAQH